MYERYALFLIEKRKGMKNMIDTLPELTIKHYKDETHLPKTAKSSPHYSIASFSHATFLYEI